MPESNPQMLRQVHNILSQSHLPITERYYPDIEGTLLGFDFGEKRTGVAVGETMLKLAHPLVTIQASDNASKFSQIAALLKEWHPVLLVVGLPSYLDGTEHALTTLTKKFAQRLEGRFNLPVVMHDERLSSAEASSRIKQATIMNDAQEIQLQALKNIQDIKQMIDQVSAQIILQSYFDTLP